MTDVGGFTFQTGDVEMPKQYEEIRDSQIAKGVPPKEAKSIAAATYNKRHPDHPVTGKKKGEKKGK